MARLIERFTRKIVRKLLPLIFMPSNSETLTRLGSRYGGWTLPLARLESRSICYSIGVGEDMTFDLALTEEIGCSLHLFDPTPRARNHFQLLLAASKGSESACSQLSPLYHDYSLQAFSMLTFHELGVWCEDKQIDFYEPEDSKHVSHSVTNLLHTRIGFRAVVKTIRSIATSLGHKQVDLIKMDIEGAEMAVIGDLLCRGPLPRVLCIEFDAAAHGGISEFKKLLQLTKQLKNKQYRLAHIEEWNFLFVQDSN